MATPQRTRRALPIAGTRPSVRLDDDFARDLAVLMQTGDDLSTAMRTAVGIVADIYRTAWHHGAVPVGTAPTLTAYQLAEKVPAAPPSLPWVSHDGPMWTPSSSSTSTDDARRHFGPPRQQRSQHPGRPAAGR